MFPIRQVGPIINKYRPIAWISCSCFCYSRLPSCLELINYQAERINPRIRQTLYSAVIQFTRSTWSGIHL